jgi:hypothetical protein
MELAAAALPPTPPLPAAGEVFSFIFYNKRPFSGPNSSPLGQYSLVYLGKYFKCC